MWTVGELFAGIGGFSLAFHAAGARTAWFVEREPYCQQVLAKHWPDVSVYGDIYDCHDLPHVDILTAGFPCQPFSVAGKQQGVHDERYLVPEMLRVISEVQPYVVLLENVPGFASLTDGDTFKQLLGALAEMGFDAQWGHLRASDVGAPHQRERWFCVAYTSGDRFQRLPRGNNPGRLASEAKNYLSEAALSGQMANTQLSGFQRRKPNQGCGVQASYAGLSSRTQSWRTTQSRLGRNTDGLPTGLDRPQWPARPGQPQHDWEPPRVVSAQAQRTARLKALGNAVVPQVVYPLACAIVEYLESQAQDEAGMKLA